MEDFDIFTNEIEFTKPLMKNILKKFVYEAPSTPNGPNYHSGRKLLALECLSENDVAGATFHLSEAVSSSIRTMAIYREEQRIIADDKLRNITNFIKPVQNVIQANPLTKKDQNFLNILLEGKEDVEQSLKNFELDEEPFHKRYLRFTKENNVENFHKILKDLPKEWTVVQITAPYNANENLKPTCEFRTEVDSIYVSLFSNDYIDKCDTGPITINVPANVHKVGEKALFDELYSLLEENYKTIDNAQFLNNKRLVKNYWDRREEIDLRMKSVINVMDKEWLGGFGSLLTGKVIESGWRDKVVRVVDDAIDDWGFIRLTKKQRVLLYNLIESCQSMTSQQAKTCIRRILTEHGDTGDVRDVLEICGNCTKEFRFPNELCLKCLSGCFEKIHRFTLVDGIKAFSQVVAAVKDGDEWAALKKARRCPVILIIDEMLDTFPWESLPILSHHPVCRIENIHFLYYLYKIHQPAVVDGYFTTKGHDGRYIINPEKNLDRMEKRMSSFVQYWCKDWSGYISQPPPPEEYIQYITQPDIFLYCGHGDGCQLSRGAGGGLEGGGRGAGRGAAVCVLSGCGSARLQPPAGRAPPAAAHRRLHVAGCPSVVGMLWEVTDLEVDKVVSSLLALCIPSHAPLPWPSVGKAKWSQGELDTSSEPKGQFTHESDLLLAMARSRNSTNFIMIASSMVARGLPVRIR